jgi:hypothetical protein
MGLRVDIDILAKSFLYTVENRTPDRPARSLLTIMAMKSFYLLDVGLSFGYFRLR